MAYMRTTIIDASPAGDSVKQAILDLDADLTGAFQGLNDIQGALNLKIGQDRYNAASGVPRLDDAGKVGRDQLPVASLLPVGSVMLFAGQALPDGSDWLLCDGSEVEIAAYYALYEVLGTTFGLSQDPAKFLLPDLRGEFVRGWDNGRGVDQGRAFGSAQEQALKAHGHSVPGIAYLGVGAPDAGGSLTVGGVDAAHPTQTGLGEGAETRPRNVALNYCIKWR